MNVLMLLAQGAMNMADSLATANPVLTPVSAPEMNMLDMAIKGGWIMIVLGVLSVVRFYILFERNYMIRKAGKEDPMFMERIKDYIHSGEIKAAIQYCRTMNTPSARMIEKGISRLGRPINDVQVAIENVGNLEVAKLEKGLTVMATISGGAPMLGFLGTVTGMVTRILRNGECGKRKHRYNLAFRRYLRSHDHHRRRSDRGYHCHVCLQLPGDAGRPCSKQNGSSYDGIYGPLERACPKVTLRR